jgi:hypothetical protein
VRTIPRFNGRLARESHVRMPQIRHAKCFSAVVRVFPHADDEFSAASFTLWKKPRVSLGKVHAS